MLTVMEKVSTLVFLLLAIAKVGVSAPQIGRVVDGTDASVQDYPYMVSVRIMTQHNCGGTIVSKRFVMTASHCVAGRMVAELSVQFGVSDISSSGPNIFSVDKIIMHEYYSPMNNYANDIALLRVAKEFPFDYITIAPVRLPEQDFATPQLDEGSPGQLIGWGYNETNGQIQTTLQKVDLKIYSDEECTKCHHGKTNGVHHICGGVNEGGKGQCSGDSGGPLLTEDKIQVGIVSWSVKPCTVAGYPGVYCRTSSYVNWIYDKIQ